MADNSTCILDSGRIASCDYDIMRQLFKSLEEYGLKYHFSTNVGTCDKEGTLFIEGGGAKEYQIAIRSVNTAKALKSPAAWNCIAHNPGELVNPSTFKSGISVFKNAEIISRLLDQVSLMWGNSSIEREFLLSSPTLESYQIYTHYKFVLTENGVKRDTAPIIFLSISNQHPIFSHQNFG